MGELKKRLLDGLWIHRFIDDSIKNDEFEEAIITDIHSIINEARSEFPKPNARNKESTPLYWLHKKDEWFVKWFGEE